MNHESKRPITIEDLLRLKRAERPPADFWNQFDRQLRAKQLSALVVRRPWWQRLPRISGGFSRYHVPLGAAAVLTLSFVSVRYYGGATSVGGNPPAAHSVTTVVNAAPVASVAPEGVNHDVIMPPALSLHAQATPRLNQEPVIPAEVTAQAVVASGESQLIQTGGPFEADLPRPGTDSRARYVAASLSVMQPMEPIISRNLLGSATGFENRALPVRPAIEPLQQMTPPSERSRTRLLTAMVSMVSAEAPTRTSERVADRLSEERLYDQIHRFGARGAGVSMKF